MPNMPSHAQLLISCSHAGLPNRVDSFPATAAMRAIAAALPMFLMLALLLAGVEARQLQQKGSNNNKPTGSC